MNRLSRQNPNIRAQDCDFARILIVDDDPVCSLILSRLLEALNCVTTVANSGPEAIEASKADEFELIYMDCMMPQMDGFEATERIRDNGQTNIPIIAVTANSDSETKQRCIRSGMNDVLNKPLNLAMVQFSLERWIGWIQESEMEPYEQMHQHLNDLGYPLSVIKPVLELWESLCDTWIAELTSFLEREKMHRTLQLCYQLRSSLSFLGVEHAYSSIRQMEDHANDGNWTRCRFNMEHLEAVIRDVKSNVGRIIRRFDELNENQSGESSLASNVKSERFSARRLVAIDPDPVFQVLLKNLRMVGVEFLIFSSVDEYEAWTASIAENDVGCILCTESTGALFPLEGYRKIRELDPSISVVLLSHFPSKRLVKDALENGVFQMLSKPVRLESLLHALELGIRESESRKEDVERRLVADKVAFAQRKLLSDGIGLSGGILSRLFCLPKHEAGGDFWIKLTPRDHCQLFILSDVSGHDLESAFVSAYFQGFVRGALQFAQKNIPDALEQFNHFLCNEWNGMNELEKVDKSLACAVAEVDLEKQEITFFLNGCCVPMLLMLDGTLKPVAKQTEIPLGWFEELVINPLQVSTEGVRGFCVWSDGIEDLAESLGLNLTSTIYRLLHETEAPTREDHQWYCDARDDLAVAYVSLVSTLDPGRLIPVFHQFFRGDDTSGIDAIQSTFTKSLAFVLDEKWNEQIAYDVTLCTREALLNAMKHGCKNQSEKCVELTAMIRVDSELLVVQIQDEGCPMETDVLSDPLYQLGMHRGLALIKGFCDNLEFNKSTKTLRLFFELPNIKIELRKYET